VKDMMKDITMWTLEDTKRALERGVSGIDASIAKWQTIVNALEVVKYNTSKMCGLCIEDAYTRYQNRCTTCQLRAKTGYSCMNIDSKFEEIIRMMQDTALKVKSMLSTLEDVKLEMAEQQQNKKIDTIIQKVKTAILKL